MTVSFTIDSKVGITIKCQIRKPVELANLRELLMNSSQLLLFAFSSLLLMTTPAPDMIPVITRGLGQGRRAALLTVLGYSLGDITHAILAAVGLSALLLSSVLAFKIVKYAGAAYFVYLGVRMLTSRSDFSCELQHPKSDDGMLVWQGFLSNLLNPEATLFFLAFLPQFVDFTEDNVAFQIMMLGMMFTVIGLVVYCLIAYFSGNIGLWLKSKRFVASKLKYVTGSIFIAFGIRVALQENP
ncbi:MAG: LysE family translocator [Elainellaceae cyanobacterium]